MQTLKHVQARCSTDSMTWKFALEVMTPLHVTEQFPFGKAKAHMNIQNFY